MKTIFDSATRSELIHRINTLHANSPAQWGRMNAYQMLKHCTLWDECIHGRRKYRRAFIGRLFGKVALRSVLRDDRPLPRNTPTIHAFRIAESEGDLDAQKIKWIALIEEYEHYSNPDFVHAFFGRMTREQVGYLVYKHTDHHLRQFNC